MNTITIYAMSKAVCCDCHAQIPALNEVALKVLNDAKKRGVSVRCPACYAWHNRKMELLNRSNFAELPY